MRLTDRAYVVGSRFRILRYLFVGALNTFFGLLLIALFLYGFRLSSEVSNALAYGVGILTSFGLNKTLTFRSGERVRAELPRFLFVYCLAYLANFVTLVVFVRMVGAHEFLSQIIASAVFVVTSYLLQVRYVFGRIQG